MSKISYRRGALAMAVALMSANVQAANAPQPASSHTAQANKAFGAALPLADQQDFQDAQRGLIATLPDRLIKAATGGTAWDGARFDFIKGDAPDSVNPSLWRQEKLNNQHGLFKVMDGLYQVRGYDISNMSIIAGKEGWIVVDPLTSAEVARATMDFVQQQLGKRPITAVIFTHGHVDHFGGIRGIVDEADIKSGKVRVVAPEGFMESAVAENVLAGNAMSRRAQYQFGMFLPWGAQGAVGTGLGKTGSKGNIGMVAPNEIVSKTGQQLTLDGVRMVFQMANGSEAPSEFMFYLPDMKALCFAEVLNNTMHNIYTLRGAKVRDALGWSKYINQLLDAYPDAEVGFTSHNWPVWGKERVRGRITNQRDMYRYIHDEALRLANSGVTMEDLANVTYYPKALRNDFSTHGYYGTLSHNLRGVYNFYLGFYDGNPATLNPLPRVDSARQYVAAMGGANAVLAKMKEAHAKGDYRWAVEIGNHLVFAQPDNKAAREQQAAALEQLGYQAESGVWRNEYLSAAQELRAGVDKKFALSTHGADLVRAMPMEMLFDYLAVRLNHEKADGLALGINVRFTDTGERYALELSNSVLHNTRDRELKQPNATLEVTQAALLKLLLKQATMPQLVQGGELTLSGDPQALGALFGKLDQFEAQFPIVTP
ncbi:MBL fold metallo-hydrolase [Duganella sp. FT92W]|uniref:MBL fold metallo-hydrolase n=1 Tax=Pseudoduganella rivuli TaxID=2666085 RepID=A0A7X2ISX9_9BURK|nr:alkyl sulfatase dimerization domain-containing protein [Pseudoduganella rivuli]MRV75507.1 MBL fold metallo-hydrolase [Pseudoduganella rivuli]